MTSCSSLPFLQEMCFQRAWFASSLSFIIQIEETMTIVAMFFLLHHLPHQHLLEGVIPRRLDP